MSDSADVSYNSIQPQPQQQSQRIKKRDGRITDFDKTKIVTAVNKALAAVHKPDSQLATELADEITNRLLFRGYWNTDNLIPSVEEIQDMVEEELLKSGHTETAKAYVLYRHEREELRKEKCKVLNKTTLDDVDKSFDINALRVLASRYLIRDEEGNIIESPKQMFERIAIHMTIPDILYDTRCFSLEGNESDELTSKVWADRLDQFAYKLHIGEYYLNKYHFAGLVRLYDDLAKKRQMRLGFNEILTMIAKGEFADLEKQVKEYYQLMIDRDFLPNTPTLMNAGARLGQLSACFVLPMHDNIESIMKTASDTAFIFKSGGGVGINYSDLRPKGHMVFSTSGVASGPVSFMQIVNTITEVVKQGGKRRGANMGIMDVTHEDIEEFITAKTKPGVLENFNVSVGVYESFWNQLVDGVNVDEAKTKHARQLLDIIAHSAWKSAEPGVIFFDNINRHNPMLAVQGPLRATNPCGEQSLYPYESCNLGSINLANFIDTGLFDSQLFDWQRFTKVVAVTTRFLDNVIDMNKYPVEEIAEATKQTRRIGLGIMGIADLLFKLQIPYASKKGYELMEEIAEALTFTSMAESVAIAMRRGSFPLFDKSTYPDGDLPIAFNPANTKVSGTAWDTLRDDIKANGLRNSWTTTIAPTGTLSMIAHCSNGVEPVFAMAFEKRVTVGSFFYTNHELEQVLKREGLYSDDLIKKIINNYGSVKGLDEIPKWIQDVFVTAMDLHWCDHIMAQAIWQRWISNAIAKTINMPNDVTVEDIKNAYLLAHELGLKGVTVYRDGSRHEQVLHIHSDTKDKNFEVTPSDYVMNYVFANVTEPFVRERVLSMFEETVPAKSITIDLDQAVTKEGVRVGFVASDTTSASPSGEYDRMYLISTETENEHDHDHDHGRIMGTINGESCPECHDPMVVTEGCKLCVSCGFSYCSSS